MGEIYEVCHKNVVDSVGCSIAVSLLEVYVSRGRENKLSIDIGSCSIFLIFSVVFSELFPTQYCQEPLIFHH